MRNNVTRVCSDNLDNLTSTRIHRCRGYSLSNPCTRPHPPHVALYHSLHILNLECLYTQQLAMRT